MNVLRTAVCAAMQILQVMAVGSYNYALHYTTRPSAFCLLSTSVAPVEHLQPWPRARRDRARSHLSLDVPPTV